MYSARIKLEENETQDIVNQRNKIREDEMVLKNIKTMCLIRRKLPKGKRCFVYYVDWCAGKKYMNVDLFYLDDWEVNDTFARPCFQYIDKDGKPSRCANDISLKAIEFEVVNESLADARKILKDVKKQIAKQKKELEEKAKNEPPKEINLKL